MLFVAIALSGCAGKNKSAVPGVAGAEGGSGEWLCEAGKSLDDWDCIQSEDIAPALQERAARARSQTISSPPQAPTQALEPPGTDAPPPPQQSPNAVPPAAVDQVPTSEAAPPLQTPTQTRRQEPAYAELAYRPEEPVRIIDLPENFYAAQLLAVSTKEQIEKFVVAQDLYNMSAARIERDGQILYVLLLGVYESKEIAQQAVAAMPAPVRSMQPWVRPIDGLQDAMVRADRAAATAKVTH